ncbi:MAG: hypothetical protein MUD11_07610 [Rhodobacteraceae bacterium]|jgi:hypothetical protein|nr:hypothetical protein [Paracoccaceae bacterium]
MTDSVRTVLVIDGAKAGNLPDDTNQVCLPFSHVSAQVLGKVLPELVILPLFGTGFDAIEALGLLERLGYRGAVLVRTPNLPNARLVERELAAVAPGLTVRLTGPASS